MSRAREAYRTERVSQPRTAGGEAPAVAHSSAVAPSERACEQRWQVRAARERLISTTTEPDLPSRRAAPLSDLPPAQGWHSPAVQVRGRLGPRRPRRLASHHRHTAGTAMAAISRQHRIAQRCSFPVEQPVLRRQRRAAAESDIPAARARAGRLRDHGPGHHRGARSESHRCRVDRRATATSSARGRDHLPAAF